MFTEETTPTLVSSLDIEMPFKLQFLRHNQCMYTANFINWKIKVREKNASVASLGKKEVYVTKSLVTSERWIELL